MSDSSEAIAEMFVQVAQGAVGTGGELILRRVGSATLYFADRPQRACGHITTRQFVAQWAEGENSFAANAPQAVLSFAGAEEDHHAAVVVLRNPRLADGSITYAIDVLNGTIPRSGGACALFIDPAGRPLPPSAILELRRRDGTRSAAGRGPRRLAGLLRTLVSRCSRPLSDLPGRVGRHRVTEPPSALRVVTDDEPVRRKVAGRGTPW